MAAKWCLIFACAGFEVTGAVVESSGVGVLAAGSPPVFRVLTEEERAAPRALAPGSVPGRVARREHDIDVTGVPMGINVTGVPMGTDVTATHRGIDVTGVLRGDSDAVRHALEFQEAARARAAQAGVRRESVSIYARTKPLGPGREWFELDRVIENTCVVGTDPMDPDRSFSGVPRPSALPENSVIVQIDVPNDRGSEWVMTDTTGDYGPDKLRREIARANARCSFSAAFCHESQYYRPNAGPEIWVHYVTDAAEAERQQQLVKDMAAAVSLDSAAITEPLDPRSAYALPGLESLRRDQERARGPAQHARELQHELTLQASALDETKRRMRAAKVNDSVRFVLKQSNSAWLTNFARLNKQSLDKDTLYTGYVRNSCNVLYTSYSYNDAVLRLTVNGIKTKIRATDVFSFENDTRPG